LQSSSSLLSLHFPGGFDGGIDGLGIGVLFGLSPGSKPHPFPKKHIAPTIPTPVNAPATAGPQTGAVATNPTPVAAGPMVPGSSRPERSVLFVGLLDTYEYRS